MQMTSLTWQCVVEVGMPAILQTITTTEAVSTTVKPKLKRKVAEKNNKLPKSLYLELKITLASSCWSSTPSSQSPGCRNKPFLSEMKMFPLQWRKVEKMWTKWDAEAEKKKSMNQEKCQEIEIFWTKWNAEASPEKNPVQRLIRGVSNRLPVHNILRIYCKYFENILRIFDKG